MRSPIIALALSLAVLTACSGGEEEAAPNDAETVSAEQEQVEAAWRADVEETLGTDTFDFNAIQQQAAADCQRTTEADWTVSLGLAGSVSSTDLTRVGLEHLCSDVVATYDKVRKTIEEAPNPTELVCQLSPDELSTDDQMKVQMVCRA